VLLGGVVEHAVTDRDERDIAERELRPSPYRTERALERADQRGRDDVLAQAGSPCVHARIVVVLVTHCTSHPHRSANTGVATPVG
jgi:hypothetical protein